MQSKATTVEQYLAGLPEDRRAALSAVREVILKNLDKDYREGMQYGMIGYCVPHEVFGPGYHCDPRQPLPFGGLASQKTHMSMYFMCTYGHQPTRRWFESAWKKTGKKLDMGKSCIRFKKLEDVPLEVIGELVRRTPAKAYVDMYMETLAQQGKGPDGKPIRKAGSGKAGAKRKKATKTDTRGSRAKASARVAAKASKTRGGKKR